MDFDENEITPESIRTFLIQQIEENSDFCDVTIKAGHWEKRFHRCVLIKSPFFECVLKHKNKETETGKIEIKIATPNTVEMAVMFLYGKMPSVTMDNVEALMTLSEFFFIPNLKAACVDWLKVFDDKVNYENCLELLHIASLFDIELPNCIKYLDANLDKILVMESFVHIDFDSVRYIFTERKLAYVSTDDKLKFLIKWTKADLTRRIERSKVLVTFLNFSDNSKELLTQVENDPLYLALTENIDPSEKSSHENQKHDVLLMKGEDSVYSFWCLDMTRNKWFRLDTETSMRGSLSSNFDLLRMRNTESNMYYTMTKNENMIVCFDLETCDLHKLSLVDKDNDSSRQFNQVYMFEDVCIATENNRVEKPTKIIKPDLRKQSGVKDLSWRRPLGISNSGKSNRPQKRIFIDTTDVYIGHVEHSEIETKLLFTILNETVSNTCMNMQSSVAFILHSRKRIIVYDINEFKIEFLEEQTENDDRICAAKDGFVVFNKKRCIYLKRIQGPALGPRYQKTFITFAFTGTNLSSTQVHFFNDRWFRFRRVCNTDDYHIEWAAHDKIIAAKHQEDVEWTPLPLPMEANKCRYSILPRVLFHVRLSKSKLKCDIECPHCKGRYLIIKRGGNFYQHTGNKSVVSLDDDYDFYNNKYTGYDDDTYTYNYDDGGFSDNYY